MRPRRQEAAHPTQAQIIARARERVQQTGTKLDVDTLLADRDERWR